MEKRFVILDRDGTVIVERNYLSKPEEVELLPNAISGLKQMRARGLGLLLVTNQSGIARGMFDAQRLDAVHQRMSALLAAGGVFLDGIYVCPHTPEDRCDCRKPATGLVSRAASELGFEPRSTFVIGDKETDIELGARLGGVTILVETGYGARHLADGRAKPQLVARDLREAAQLIDVMLAERSDPRAERLRTHLLGSIETKRRLLDICEDAILRAASRVAERLQKGGKILLCGNGGSAADCQHIAAEFVSVLTQNFLRPGLPAIALTTDSSVLTASANDFGFEGIFARQVQALGRAGDVVIGISTSGNSENVVRALRYAAGHGMSTIALTGANGGKVAESAELSVRTPSVVVQHIQEAHITIGHILCDLVEREIFPCGPPANANES